MTDQTGSAATRDGNAERRREDATREEPTSVELGPAGAPIGAGTSPDVVAEREAEIAAGARRWQLGDGWLGRLVGRVAPFVVPGQDSQLRDEAFRTFWLTRLAAQTAQGALLYGLLIIVVDRTDASFYNSLFVVCSIVPAIAFGLPGGIVVDALPRRTLLVGLNLARFLFLLSLIVQTPSLVGIFAATLGIWTIHQFYSPCESATMAAIVPRERYTAAQALSNLALTLAQLLGLVILAPLLLKTAGPRTLFAVCATLFVVAAGFAALLPRLDEHLRTARRHRSLQLRAQLLSGWRVARADRVTYEALADDVLVGIGMSALVVIVPLYLKRVLGTEAENTVFVFAPAALGLVAGLRLAPPIGRAIGERRVATGGLVIFATCVAALGFVETLRAVLTDTLRLPLGLVADLVGIPPLVIVTMLISIPAGFASALVSVTARSVLLERTAPAARGQVVATQSLLNNLGALVPTLLAGVAADLFGVEPIAVAIAVAIAGGALIAHLVGRRPMAIASPTT